MNELFAKNQLFFYYSMLSLIFRFYASGIDDMQRMGVDLDLMKKNNFRIVEVTRLRSKYTTIMTYSYNENGGLLRCNFSKFNSISDSLVFSNYVNYEFDDKMFLTREEVRNGKDSILFDHTYHWSFLSPTVLRITETGYRYNLNDHSVFSKIEVPADNSITLTLDSNNHILKCLIVNDAIYLNDTIVENCSYNDKDQMISMITQYNIKDPSQRLVGSNYFFKYNEQNLIAEEIQGNLNYFSDTSGTDRFIRWVVNVYDDQNRLSKKIYKRDYIPNKTTSLKYHYRKQGKIRTMKEKRGRLFPFKTEECEFYDNGLMKKTESFIRYREGKTDETLLFKYE